jgi:hypothetical protein
MSQLGQTLLSHSALVRINVCCSPQATKIVEKWRMTKRANTALIHPSKKASLFDHLVRTGG